MKAAAKLYVFLEGQQCQVYGAPFDVRFPKKSKKDRKIHYWYNHVCEVYGPSKLDNERCIGVLDPVVAILSPGNNEVDLKNKYELYHQDRAKEYWVIHLEQQTLSIYSLVYGESTFVLADFW